MPNLIIKSIISNIISIKANNSFLLFFIITILLVAFSCKKVTDDIDPGIIIEFPLENESFNLPDTMFIKAVVSDDKNIESIQIVITNELFIPVFGGYSFPPNGNPTTIEDELVIDDILMESGVYYLKIKAFDGVNSKNAYRKIYINEVARELENVIIITKNTGNLDVQSIDPGFSLSTLFSVNGFYEVSEINSRYQLLYVAGRYYDNLNAFDLIKNEKEWTIEGKNNPPLPYFRNLYLSNDILYVSNSESEIRAYNDALVNIATAVLQANRVPGKCIEQGDYLISEAKEIAGVHSYLLSFFTVSGSLYNERLIDMDVIGLFPRGENQVYVVANNSADGGVFVYDIQSNGLDEIRTFAGDMVIGSEFVDENNLLIAFADGVYLYKYSFNSLTAFVANISVGTMSFDKLANILYIAESNKVSSYTYPQGSFVNSVDIPKQIMNMHLHYNK